MNWDKAPIADLFDKIQVTMPGDRPGQLSRQQTADILAYILAANKVPPGSSELPSAEDA